ncbi:ABC-F family ATP-binding cassette domain-containing protein [Sporolactobacillus shoreicorticis]|uniref:ABC-F family ATP-binding cassette domain-containing protein n=1 Tax=Sporolactobacillus shoreicorticis TaxID=1923877 RepID=A0ABW5S8Z0_9BACL|nr:ABC-F family ATP-binding cassette domain-containing protein [Sporolactobacillus shoreicorticis]MCO7125483.1 ABC-F family ATP-binding cassette domain-containing protein [Sporolactobacillus shoreicorticis]
MSILDVENLYKTYGTQTLFDHLSFSISEGERIGLIGVNGTGKSTLLNVLAGKDSAESGNLRHANAFQLAYLAQTPTFEPGVTALDYIYGGTSSIMVAVRNYEQALRLLEKNPNDQLLQEKLLERQQQMDTAGAWDAEAAAKSILTRLGIHDFETPVSESSGGQKKRVALAKALIQPADLLILDEPTNHLDNDIIDWLEEALNQYPGALLMVTHDRYFLNRVTRKIFELDHGHLYIYDGNYELFLEKKAEREEQESAGETKHQNQLRRELAWLRRGAKARSTKQKARVERVHEMQEHKGPERKQSVDLAIGSTRLGKKVIEAKQVSKSFNGQPLMRDFDLLVTPGERVGIIGSNGSGKTTLLNILAGHIESDSGAVEIGDTVKIGYYTQEHAEMNEDLTVIDYIKEAAQVMRTADGQQVTAEQMLERFLFSRPRQRTFIRKLSGGEHKRLYLLRVLMSEPNVLFLDEPTNDLDTETLTILEDYLLQFPGTVLAVSHDRYFLDRIADRLIAFEEDGIIRRFEGNYSEYMDERKEEQAAMSKAKAEKMAVPKHQQTNRKKKKLTYKEQQEWIGIEDRIATLEDRVEQLKREIVEAGSNAGKVQELFVEQQQTETELDQAMERWTELSLKVEEIEKQQ